MFHNGMSICNEFAQALVNHKIEDLNDIAMYPRQENRDAFILEFKVHNEKQEENLEQTADNALKQIEDREYEKDLLAVGIPVDRIYKLGFAFSGKDVLVKENAQAH